MSERSENLRGALRSIDAALSTEEPARPDWGGFLLLPLLGHGARIAVGDDHGAVGEVAPFCVIGSADAPHRAPAIDAAPPDRDAISEYELECMVPSAAWSAEDQAWFWRVKAKAFWFDYADASLNLTADALERALDWHLVHEPEDAALLWAARLRARLYASWSTRDVAAELQQLLAHVETIVLPPAEERHLVLQLLEILDRIRTHEPTFASPTLLALARRGLALSDALGATAQRARMLHGLADALTQRDGPPDGEAIAEARGAWEQALSLEDGDFYGKKDRRHLELRTRTYRERLARLELEHGDRSAGLDALSAVLAEIPSPYDARDALRRTVRWLRERGLERAPLLERVLRAHTLERPEPRDGWEADTLLKLVRYVDYELAEVSADPEAIALLGEVFALPAIAAAVERERAKAAASRARTTAATEKLLAALFSRSPGAAPVSEEARREQALLAALDEVVRERRAELLLVRQRVSVGSELELSYVVNVPEHSSAAIREDLEPVLRDLDAAARACVPGAQVRIDLTPLALGLGLSDRTDLALALGRAGATRTLAALGLEARHEEVDVAALAEALRSRIMEVRMWHR